MGQGWAIGLGLAAALLAGPAVGMLFGEPLAPAASELQAEPLAQLGTAPTKPPVVIAPDTEPISSAPPRQEPPRV